MAQHESITRYSTLFLCDHPRCDARYEIIEHVGSRGRYDLDTSRQTAYWARADSDRATTLKDAGWTTIDGPNPRHMCRRHAIRKSYPSN